MVTRKKPGAPADAQMSAIADIPKRGRPPDTGVRRDQYIKVRATADELHQFEAVGGTAWLRRALKRAYARLKGGQLGG